MAVTACAGTEGDVLRSSPDASIADVLISDAPIADVLLPEASVPDASAPDVSVPDARPPGDAPTPRPKPEPLTTWQIQLSGGSLDTTVDARVYVSDIETPTSVIRSLHGAGRIVICYFSAGTMEPFREDAPRFPPESLGMQLSNYPERWLDVRHATVRAIMQDRLAKAARVECDGVHPSGLAGFGAATGFDFTRADQLAYNRWLASAAHALGLSIGLVDGDVSLSQELLADFDWRVVFGCLSTNCAASAPFVGARKAAFLVEYGDESRVAEVCPRARELGLSAIIKRNGNLDAFRAGCP
jgi:hypothetical protein